MNCKYEYLYIYIYIYLYTRYTIILPISYLIYQNIETSATCVNLQRSQDISSIASIKPLHPDLYILVRYCPHQNGHIGIPQLHLAPTASAVLANPVASEALKLDLGNESVQKIGLSKHVLMLIFGQTDITKLGLTHQCIRILKPREEKTVSPHYGSKPCQGEKLSNMCMCLCVYIYMISIYIYTHTHTYIIIYIYT